MVVPRQSTIVAAQRVSNAIAGIQRMEMPVVHVGKRVRCNCCAKVGGRATSCLTQKHLGRARRTEATRGGLSKGEVLDESKEK